MKSCVLALVLPLLAASVSMAEVDSGKPAMASSNLVGGWCAKTEVDGKEHGQWLALAADGTWRRIEDHFGFHAEDDGRWRPDGDDAVFDEAGVRLHPAGGKLLLSYQGRTLYAFSRCQAIPQALRNLPPFPRTLSETVAILSAELPARQKTVLAGTVEDDLQSHHDGLGMHIRNRFGLWGNNPALLAACKTGDPNDASDVILRSLRDHLRHTRPGGREIDRLEEVFGDVEIAAIAVRHLTLAQFVASLNQEARRALRRKNLLEDALVFELAPPSNEDERQRRAAFWLNHPPRLHAWGQHQQTQATELAELLAGFRKWLEAPNRVVLEPGPELRGYQAPQTSPDFASARWRGDWFEIETSTESANAAVSRFDQWGMIGPSPPMPPEQAFQYASVARERTPPGKAPLEVEIVGSSTSAGQGPWRWSYLVRSSLTPLGPDTAAPVVEDTDLRRSLWPDQRTPPRLSPAQALSRFRKAMRSRAEASLLEHPTSIQIALKRAAASRSWYYEVGLFDGDASVTGYVTLDGRAIRSSDDARASE